MYQSLLCVIIYLQRVYCTKMRKMAIKAQQNLTIYHFIDGLRAHSEGNSYQDKLSLLTLLLR
ncbi:hypothetical protein HBNCFIEN_01427 [Legionella sp. PC997]|nr:hypothetical protein HBNCFIEN_01427 [Legionella sp. PC997]